MVIENDNFTNYNGTHNSEVNELHAETFASKFY